MSFYRVQGMMKCFCRQSELSEFEFPWGPFSMGQRLQPKEPENGGQKAVDAVETEASAAQVAWYGGRWVFWNPGEVQAFWI